MSLSPEQFQYGIDIDKVQILSGDGPPLGAVDTPTGVASVAAVYYDKLDPRAEYRKTLVGLGADKWTKNVVDVCIPVRDAAGTLFSIPTINGEIPFRLADLTISNIPVGAC